MQTNRENRPAPGRRGSHAEVVVVTGASAGVGRAVVRRFASEGARIALLIVLYVPGNLEGRNK